MLLAAFAAARADRGTVVLPDGRFADRAMVWTAERVTALADRYGVSELDHPA